VSTARATLWSRWGERGTAGAVIPASVGFDGVSHAYGAAPSLRGVSFAVGAGEIVALLGPSGCGKTTLLRIAAGVEQQTAGTVSLDGRVVAGPGVFVPAERRGIGLMFQDYALFPHMTNLANVMFGLRRLDAEEAARAARSALERVGLGRYADQHPDALSGGEQQRVALARAIAPRPRVLLMDEPFSGLDRRLRDSVREETLAILRETHATSLVVTHDSEEAMRMADRIVLMRAGELVQVGTAEEIYARPADLSAARFFSELNEIETTIAQGSADTPLGRFPAPGLPDGPGILAVRLQGVRALPREWAGIDGKVIGRRFLGEVAMLDIALAGLDNPIRARVRRSEGPLPGEEVRVIIDPGEALVFEASRP
jgi:iron(III) transport system ATP-binding protein